MRSGPALSWVVSVAEVVEAVAAAGVVSVDCEQQNHLEKYHSCGEFSFSGANSSYPCSPPDQGAVGADVPSAGVFWSATETTEAVATASQWCRDRATREEDRGSYSDNTISEDGEIGGNGDDECLRY